jgi:hypothetical protein|nr:MAG TPA: hypothetical protein [Caudoviricetes sp.]
MYFEQVHKGKKGKRMEKGDWSLDFEKVREKKLEEGELKRVIAAAERVTQELFEQRGDSRMLEGAIWCLQALYELEEIREEKRKRVKRAESLGRIVTLQTLYDEYQYWDSMDPVKAEECGFSSKAEIEAIKGELYRLISVAKGLDPDDENPDILPEGTEQE